MRFSGMSKRTAVVLAAGAFALVAVPATAAMTEAQVKSLVASETGGQILKVEPATVRGQPAFAVKVMNPGGNDNGAFQVFTVLIDAGTGTVLPETSDAQPNVPMTGAN